MPSYVTLEGNLQFAEILESICVKLQITETQFKQAEQHYDAISKLLSKPGSRIARYSPYIYPQGSLRLDTTVKPKGQNEFDLDAVCKLYIAGDPGLQFVYDLVWECMHGDGTYRPMIEALPRCIRVNYAGDFHLDIVPAIPNGNDERIYIPDIPKPHLRYWKSSNPPGIANWFVLRGRTLTKMAEARVDPLRRPVPVHLKPTLNRTVQLFKRWRDVRFEGQMQLSPTSIVLTTLSAQLHGGEEWCSDSLATILTKIRTMTRGEKIKLYNPVNHEELISERWEKDDDAYVAFVEGIADFQERWLDLIHSRGLPQIAKELEALFGETAISAFREITKPFNAARAARAMYVTKGTRTLTEASGPESYRVEKNYFFGD